MGAVGAGLGAVGSVLGGIAGANSASYSAKIARLNANLAATQANTALDQGDVAAQRAMQQGDQKLSAQRAQMAANGVAINSGSALQVQQGTATETGQNVAGIKYNALVNATNYRNQVVQADNEISAAKQQEAASIFGGVAGAATSLAGAASQFAPKWSNWFSSTPSFSGSGANVSSDFDATTDPFAS